MGTFESFSALFETDDGDVCESALVGTRGDGYLI